MIFNFRRTRDSSFSWISINRSPKETQKPVINFYMEGHIAQSESKNPLSSKVFLEGRKGLALVIVLNISEFTKYPEGGFEKV